MGIRWLYGAYMATGKKHSLAVLPGSVARNDVDEFRNSLVKSLPVSGTGSGILNGGLDPLDAVLGVGMCAEEFRRAVACSCRSQDLHHTDHLVRVVARIIHETNAQIIGFQFVIPPKLEVDQLSDQDRDLCPAGTGWVIRIIGGNDGGARQTLR